MTIGATTSWGEAGQPEQIPARMRAAVLGGVAGGGNFAVTEVDVPAVAKGDVLVRLLRTGICGSDVHFVLDGRSKTAYTPITLGHESVGVVAALGAGVTAPSVGTRVSVVPLVTCMKCPACRGGRTVLCKQRLCLGADIEGTYTSYVSVPARNCLPVPEGLSDELAAVATDSVATAYHATALRGGVRAGSRVAVWGTGGLGLAAVGVARTLGAETVIAIDPRPEARVWALETGADEALPPDGAIERLASMGGGVDVALEFVGTERTAELAVRSLDHGGRAVIVGVGTGHVSAGRLMTFVLREREVVGSYGNEPEEVARCLELMATGALSLPRAVGDVIRLDDIVEGMHRVQDGRTGGARILVDLSGEGNAAGATAAG
jgi:threonine dehydrogenase-like Zn-dependent dehydrogenase